MKRHIPNALTLLNVFCGCCALVCLFDGAGKIMGISATVFFIGISLIADFLDGFAARLLNVKSELGKELDSLADMVTFGVVPGVILYKLLTFNSLVLMDSFNISAAPAFIITAFSCYRLAKFNLDVRQTDSFIGLNTPANTLFFLSLWMTKLSDSSLSFILDSSIFLYALIPLSSFLLVSEIPMFSFKFKGFGWKGNELQFVFIAVSVLILLWLKMSAFALIIPIYVLVNVGRMVLATGKKATGDRA